MGKVLRPVKFYLYVRIFMRELAYNSIQLARKMSVY